MTTVAEHQTENVEEPLDVTEVPVTPGQDIARAEGGMDLTIRRDQDRLTKVQYAALQAVVNFDPRESDAQPHVQQFLHLCLNRGLDPWAREAYLIARGEGNKRKFTMQVGIDGFRKQAASTGRMIRVKETVWTGSDDDDRAYRLDETTGVMRRVWYDQWPISRGYPGAARVTLEHYDESGNVVETTVVADWKMYAPEVPEWHWGDKRGEKVFVKNADGSQKMTLNDMWTKGPAHMLSKCCEALAYRKAFPATFSGQYTHEEMHRLDQAEKDRRAEAMAAARRGAYQAAQGITSKPTVVGQIVQPEPAQDTDPAGPSEPILDVGVVAPEPSQPEPEAHDAEVVEEVVEEQTAEPTPEPETDPEVLQAWLLDEIHMIADIMGVKVEQMCRRFMVRFKGNVDQFTVDQLREVVATLRPTAVDALQQAGRADEAQAYARVTPDEVGPMERLLGLD